MNTKWLKCLFLTACAGLVACGSDQTEPDPTDCADGLSYDPIQGECVRLSDGPIDEGPTVEDMGGHDEEDSGGSPEPADSGLDPDVSAVPDAGMDVGPMPDLGCITDEDGDGVLAQSCGGDDCDDADARRAPGRSELCDEVDNNCDEVVNEGLDCSLYAHSSSRLYRLDIFTGTFDDLGPTVPDLYDIDTHPDGTLYGIAGDRVHAYDPGSGTWNPRPQTISVGFAEQSNGFCIDNNGTAYITTNGAIGGGKLKTVDLATGSSTDVGSLMPESSSGDCVVSKGNVLYMTSNATTPDSFVKLNGVAPVSPTRIGVTSRDGIWGLTAAWNRVFGLTDQGEVVEIDVMTAQTTVVQQFPGLSFYGAASDPAR